MPSLQSNILTVYKAFVLDRDSDNGEQHAAYSTDRNLATVLLALKLYAWVKDDRDTAAYYVIPPKIVVKSWEEFNPTAMDDNKRATVDTAIKFIERYVEAEFDDGSWDTMSITVVVAAPVVVTKDTYAP